MANETAVIEPTKTPIDATGIAERAGGGSTAVRDAISSLRERIESGAIKLVPDEEATAEGSETARRLADALKTQREAADDAVAAGEDEGESTETELPPGVTRQADGRYRDESGKFVPDPTKPAPDKAASETEEETPVETVSLVLKGHTDSGEKDIEVEVEPEIAERIRRLENDGMRKAEFTRRLDAIQAKESDYRAMMARMSAAPGPWVQQALKPEDQVLVAKALVAEHFQELVPLLVEWAEKPHLRELFKKDNVIALRDAEKQWESQSRAQREEVRILRQIEDTLPDGVAENRADRFRVVAQHELNQWMQANQNQIPTRESVQQLLESLAVDFGLKESARPVATETKGAGDTKKAGTQSVRPTPSAKTEKRLEDAKRSREIARRVAPAGAGGVPTNEPTVPRFNKGKAPIRDTIKFLRENPGMLTTQAGGGS